MIVHVFSDSTLRVGVSNPDPSNTWAIKLADVWSDHVLVEKFNFAAPEVQFIWHVLSGASTLYTKKHIQRFLNGQNPEPFEDRIICLCSTTLNGLKKTIQKLVCAMPQKWQHFRPRSSQDTGATCISGQLEEPHAPNEKQAKVSLMSSLMKEVLKSASKSTMINELFTDECRTSRLLPWSHRHSESHALQNGNLERHEVSKIEDRVHCQICFKYLKASETFCTCARMLQGVTEEVKKQAEQRVNSRFITYVPGIHNSALKNTQRGGRWGKSEESQKSKEQKIACIPRRSVVAERSRGGTSRTSSIKCACTNKDTRNPTWKNSTEYGQCKKRNYVPSSGERAYDIHQYNVVQLCEGGGSDTVKTGERLGYEQIVQWKRETRANNRQNPMLNSGLRCLHGLGHFHQGLHGGILRRRKHGDQHHNLPHLMSQHSSWTQGRSQAHATCCCDTEQKE